MTQGQSQVKVLTINKFAEICLTTPKALRLYQKKGLLKPARSDSFTGYRYYLPQQARTLMQIKLLQHFNFSLKEISQILKKKNLSSYIEENIKRQKQELIEKQKENNFLQNIQNFLLGPVQPQLVKQSSVGPWKLIVKTIDSGDYAKIADYLKDLRAVAKQLKIKTGTKELVYYIDRSYKPHASRLEVALIINNLSSTKSLILPEGILIRSFSKIPAKVFTYRGPFQYLNLIYQKLLQEYNLSKGSFFDIYQNPDSKKSQYDQVTKLVFPS